MGPGPSGPAASAAGDLRERLMAAADSEDKAAVDHVLGEQNALTSALAYHEEVVTLRQENELLVRALARALNVIEEIRVAVRA